MKKRIYTYPPVSQWRRARSKFDWIDLKDNQMVIQEDNDYSLYVIVKHRGTKREHIFIPNEPYPEGYSLVHKEQYPQVFLWEKTNDFSVKLNNGEYTIVVHPPTGRGHYILAKFNGVLRIHAYLQYGKFKEGRFKHVQSKEE